MKTQQATVILLITILNSFFPGIYAQTGKNWKLSGAETGNKTYIARDYIQLTPDFTYIASPENTFIGKIDPMLVFPPDENTYDEDGAVVGNLSGSLDVSSSGAAIYSIPINCLPGINGMQPNISLVYNSQGGNGIAGMGWNLSGLSMIARTGKNYYYDDEKSGIIWKNTSPLTLDGQRLLEVQRWTTDSVEYTTESGLDKIIGYNIKSWGPLYFKVYLKNGNVLEYGNPSSIHSYYPMAIEINANVDTSSRLENLGWMLTKITDSNNNFIEFIYTSDMLVNDPDIRTSHNYYVSPRILSIVYGNHTGTTKETVAQIQFQYLEQTSPYIAYLNGNKMSNKYVLEKIFIQDGAGTTVNTYSLFYNSNENLYFLDHIKTSNPQDEFIRPLQFEWSKKEYNYEYTVGYPITQGFHPGQNEISNDSVTFDKTPVLTSYDQVDKLFCPYSYGDMDGDGLTDVLVQTSLKEGSSKDYWIVYRNTGNGKFQYKYEYQWDKDNEKTFLFLDLDNDGKDELYVGRAVTVSSSYWYYLNCYKYIDNSFQKYSSGDKRIQITASIYNKKKELYVVPGDFLGNGIPQFILFSNNNKMEAQLGLPAFDLNTFGGNSKSKIILTDINGNGKQEIAYINDDTTNFYEFEGEEFVSLASSKAFRFNDHFHSGDFNGDGNTDLLVQKGYSPYNWKIWVSTGHSLREKDINPEIESTVGYHKVIVLDINKDGKSDILVNSPNFISGVASSATLKFLISKGEDFIEQIVDEKAKLTNGTFTLASKFKTGHAQDVFINANFTIGGPQIYSLSKNIWFNKITKITDSFGENLTVSYNENKNPYSAAPKILVSENNGVESESVVNNILPQMEVVKQITATTINNSFTYNNPVVHRQGRGFLGFANIQTKNVIDSITTDIENKLNTAFYFLYPYKNTCKTTGGTNISESISAYTILDKEDKKYFLRLDTIISTDALKEITMTATYSNYDSVRNPKTITTDFGEGITTVESLTYAKAGSRFLNKVSSKEITQTAPGQPNLTRKEYSFYDEKGNLTRRTKDSLDVNQVQIFYTDYDKYGNPRKIETVANGISRSETFTYSSSGRFVKTHTNDQFNETTTYEYDESKGLLTSKTNRLGTTGYKYDDFDRLTLTTYPDGIQTAGALQWATNEGPAGAKYYSYAETSGQSPVWVWYDALGREIRNESYGLNKNKIWVDTEYDAKGRLYRVSEPYFEGDSQTWATTYFYDTYGRNKTTVTLMGTTTYGYSDLTTTVTSPAGSKETTTNTAGWVISQISNGKKVDFTHYASGLVQSATPDGGEAIFMEYDLQGNRTKLTDPDAGVIISEQDGWGQLMLEKQAVHNASDTITTTYDYLPSGLLNSKLRNGEKTGYKYDNLFRVSEITIDKKHTQSFEYDSFDRIIQSTDKVDAKLFVRRTEYDPLGRIYREMYPGGYYISNLYDSYGYLTKVTDIQGNEIW